MFLYLLLMMQKPTEILFNKDGTVYHLNVHSDDLADNILLVGDPGRVKLISSMFSDIKKTVSHREFLTTTGNYSGKPVTVISTGIGVDNIDIVINELQIAANYDSSAGNFVNNRTFNLIRLGTSGTMQSDIEPGSIVMTEYAIGIDGLFAYYHDTRKVRHEEMANSFIRSTNWPVSLPEPYAVGCSYSLANRLDVADHKGITLTSPGFYAPQGRIASLNPAFPDLNRRLASFSFNNLRVLNYEMESSAIYSLGRSMGHKTLTLCLVLANRDNGSFLADYKSKMSSLAIKVLDLL